MYLTKFVEVICGACGGSGKRTLTIQLYDQHGRPTKTKTEQVPCNGGCGGTGKIKVRA